MPALYGPIRRWWMTTFFDVKFADGVSEEVRDICSRYGEQIVASTFVSPLQGIVQVIGGDELYEICSRVDTRPEIVDWLAEQSSIREYRERWIPLRDLLLGISVIGLIGWEIYVVYVQEKQQAVNFKLQQEVLTNLNTSSRATADTLSALKQTTDVELQAMKESSDSAKRSANASEQSAATATKTMHLSERAYLAVEIRLVEQPKANEKLKCEAITHNSGKTPAVDSVTLFDIIVVGKGTDEQAAFAQAVGSSKFVSKTVVGEGQTIGTAIDAPDPLTEANVRSVNEGLAVLYAFLRVSYKDTFGHEHHTQACTFYSPAKQSMVNCATMNSAD